MEPGPGYYAQFDKLTKDVVESSPLPFEPFLDSSRNPNKPDSLLTPQQAAALWRGMVDPSKPDVIKITEANVNDYKKGIESEIDSRRLDFYYTDRYLRAGLVQATISIGMPFIYRAVNPIYYYVNSLQYRWRPDSRYAVEFFPSRNGESKKKAISGAVDLLIRVFRKHELRKYQGSTFALHELNKGIDVVRQDDYLYSPLETPRIFKKAFADPINHTLFHGPNSDLREEFNTDNVPLFIEAKVANEVGRSVTRLLSNVFFLSSFFSDMRRHHLERLGITTK